MSEYVTRRDLAALLGVSTFVPPLRAQTQQNAPITTPDLAVFNGRVVTLDSR